MDLPLFSFAQQSIDSLWQSVKQRFRQWTKPDNHTPALSMVIDLTRTKSELVLENAFLCQQLILLQRQAGHPNLT